MTETGNVYDALTQEELRRLLESSASADHRETIDWALRNVHNPVIKSPRDAPSFQAYQMLAMLERLEPKQFADLYKDFTLKQKPEELEDTKVMRDDKRKQFDLLDALAEGAGGRDTCPSCGADLGPVYAEGGA